MPHPEETGQPAGRGRYARRAATKRQDVAVIVYMPKSLVATLDEQATLRGLDSRSELIRRACRAMIAPAASA